MRNVFIPVEKNPKVLLSPRPYQANLPKTSHLPRDNNGDFQKQSNQFSIENILNDLQKPDLASCVGANQTKGAKLKDNDLLFDKIRNSEDNSNLKRKLTENNKIKFETVKKPPNASDTRKLDKIKNIVLDAHRIAHLQKVDRFGEEKPHQNRSQRLVTLIKFFFYAKKYY